MREPPSKLELYLQIHRIDGKLIQLRSRSRGRRHHPRPALRSKKPKHAVVAAFYAAQAQAKREALKIWPVKP